MDYGRRYLCRTQEDTRPIYWRPAEDSDAPPSIVVGLGPIVPRWDISQANTKLQYFVDARTFPDFPATDEADYAALALQQAADEWNSLGLGISISKASSRATAHYELLYDGHPENMTDGLYAEAFFPHQKDQPLIVTNSALSAEQRGILKNVFLHELGHILGLRHEFALDTAAEQLQTGVQESPNGAVQFMTKNPASVMSYVIPPTMQQTDMEGAKAFYRLKPGEEGEKIEGSVIVDFIPQLLP
jgi:hypothetical protein